MKEAVRLSILALLYSLVSLLTGCNRAQRDSEAVYKLYISTLGNDNWSGRFSTPSSDGSDGPFATLTGARDAIRKLKETGKPLQKTILVEVGEGIYELPGTFELNEQDSGLDSLSRIIYAGQKGKEVRVTGGKYITDWIPVSDKVVLESFDPSVRSRIFQADLGEIGLDDFGSPAGGGSELFFNDIPMQVSRYPNKGYIKIAGILNLDPVDVRGTKGDKTGKFIYDDRRVSRWTGEKNAWVHGYWFWDWSEERHKIASIDTTRKIMEVMPPYHTYGYRVGQWFYGFNILSEIDEPGEYYIDRSGKLIYFYPPSEIKSGKAYISVNKSIINMSNVSYVTISGLILEGCRETAVQMEDCNSSVIEACTIRNGGDGAVNIEHGQRNGVEGCDIYDVGGAGIRIESGDRKTLIPGLCFADNNYIHHIARLKRVI